jgi:hypothetical protein
MDREFWLSRWAENQIGFHRKGVNPLLQRFGPGFPGSAGKVRSRYAADQFAGYRRLDTMLSVSSCLTIAAKAFAAEQESLH